MNIEVLPSLPANDFSQLEKLTLELEGIVDEIQVDLVDGQFVPLQSWPFKEGQSVDELLLLNSLPASYNIEVDCMVENPAQYFDLFAKVDAKKVVIHFGSTDNHLETIKLAKDRGFTVGLGFTNSVPLEEVMALVDSVDYIQVMGIAEVGKQGQPFDERTIDTIKTLRESYPEITIAVDGSVNHETIPDLVKAGANRLAPGSAVAKQPDALFAYKHLLELANSQ